MCNAQTCVLYAGLLSGLLWLSLPLKLPIRAVQAMEGRLSRFHIRHTFILSTDLPSQSPASRSMRASPGVQPWLSVLVTPVAQTLAAGLRWLSCSAAHVRGALRGRGVVLDAATASGTVFRRNGQERDPEIGLYKLAFNRPGDRSGGVTWQGHRDHFKEEAKVAIGKGSDDAESSERQRLEDDPEKLARRATLAAAAESRLALGLCAPHPREQNTPPEEEMV
jgi:hypothetical protein